MKKRSIWAAVALAAALTLTLTACGGGGKEGGTPKESGSPSPEAVALTRGSWTDNVYTNESIGVTFTMPDLWQSVDDSELLQLLGTGATEITMEDQTVYEMMAQDLSKGNNVIIMMEDLAQTPGASKLSVEEYAAILAGQMTSEYTVDDTYEQEVAGQTYTVLPVRAESDGTSLSQYHMLRRVSDHMVDVLITVLGDTTVESVLAQFS